MAAKAEAGTGTAERALRRMAESEPELAARLLIQSLPAAAAALPPGLNYRLEIDGLGAWSVRPSGGPAEVTAVPGGPDLDGDAFAIETDARTLARLAAGASPVAALIRRRLRLRGKRRKALALRRLSNEAGPRQLARIGAPVDPDLVFRSLAYAIEPEWTRGQRFTVLYQLVGEGGGSWRVSVDDGRVAVGRGRGEGEPDAVVRLEVENWIKLLSGELTPSESMRRGSTELEGRIFPVTLLGRWIDRAEGVDGPELARERRQARVQASRAGSWGARVNGTSNAAGDPAGPGRRRRGGLMSYQELYALWERQNWRAHELDFSVDREQWLVTPSEAQRHTAFSMGSFYVGEERVTADLAPFVLAAPNGEIEAFLATQLVDEMRHAVFFDRWMAEVMAVDADDIRGRLQAIEEEMLTLKAWHFLFDDSLREIANRIKDRPDDLELFVEGIVTYHMVTEGVLAMPGQRIMIQYTDEHSIYPGFNHGFRLVEQDEHRHIAFGVRFLKEVCEERPEMKGVILRRLEQLLPAAAEVFMPPEADDPADFVSYGHHSSQVYGFAYQALKRRMAMIGVEVPGPERLMPGPVDFSGLDERRPLAERAVT
jgi:ribonucleoside-diphosphate reductase beta chain